MKKIVLYTAASIDAMIAPPDGSVDWLSDPRYRLPGEDYGYAAFFRTIGTSIMGYRTFRQTLSFAGEFPLKGKQNFVITRSSGRRTHPEVTFVHRNIIGTIRAARRGKGKDIWLIGGGQVNTLLLNAGLIDRMIITTIPVILGRGIPLFATNARPHNFVLKKRTVYRNGFVQAVWDRS